MVCGCDRGSSLPSFPAATLKDANMVGEPGAFDRCTTAVTVHAHVPWLGLLEQADFTQQDSYNEKATEQADAVGATGPAKQP